MSFRGFFSFSSAELLERAREILASGDSLLRSQRVVQDRLGLSFAFEMSAPARPWTPRRPEAQRNP